MDRDQEEIQFLGFFGILRESFNIVSSWRKIFTQITLSLILPLSFIYLAHIQISKLLFTKIMYNEYILDRLPQSSPLHHRIANILFSQLTTFFLFKIAYFIFFLILALLSTSAVVYTIACIYTAKDITFKKVISVVPKVWKRLILTFIWNFIIVLAYNIVSFLILMVGVILLWFIPVVGVIFMVVGIAAYFLGLFYITMIWHLASVVSVLEDSYGLRAMFKSKDLIKGKMVITVAVFLVMAVSFVSVEYGFKFLVVLREANLGQRIGLGIISVVLLTIAMLFGLIGQTIIYFVCKSYHHENIDKSSLSDHLGGYLGEYVPLKSKDVQLEQFEV